MKIYICNLIIQFFLFGYIYMDNWIKDNDSKYISIKNIVNGIFLRLLDTDKKLIINGIVDVLNLIEIKFSGGGIGFRDIFWNKLMEKNMSDMCAIINLLLPFINDDENDNNKKNLTDLRNIYTSVDKNGNFIYSNVQYERCVVCDDEKEYKIRPFLKEYFNNNLNLLLMTIDTASNKLYVNWVDILPIKMNEFKSLEMYKYTYDKMNSNDNKFMQNHIDINNGISFQDIYNVISNHLYSDVKNYKWLIYDVFYDGKAVPYFLFLKNFFKFENIICGKMWNKLTDAEIKEFTNGWNLFMAINIEYIVVFFNFYIFFCKNYVNSDDLIEKGLLIDYYDILNVDEFDDIITNSRMKESVSRMRNVPINDIYNFLTSQIELFKKSWYYYFIETTNRTYIGIVENVVITPKYIYNYCKSIMIMNDVKNILSFYPQHWQSIQGNDIKKVIQKITSNSIYLENKYQWFNVNQYIQSMNLVDTKKLNNITELIHKEIKKIFTDIIFESLICHGLLSKFVPQKELTDCNYISKIANNSNNYLHDKMRELYFTGKNKIDYENECYYFLTGEKYAKLNEIKTKNKNYKYFDYITNTNNKQGWTFIYALTWVSQLNFYHKYINNRVIYVTGSTGVGKSSQIPKLIMYSQKMIDYNTNGKIICSQPRIPPTYESAQNISKELGVPIIEYNKEYDDDISTGNFYVQYSHSQNKHTNNNSSYFRVVTDGTLKNILQNNPYLLKLNNRTQKYNTQNMYDVVIVDEAHEHNSNMDIILSLVRETLKINNSVKLLIISATMDDDEELYRRYYRNINENIAYPLNMFIVENFLDRSNVDRRIHISAPRSTTLYRVVDNYLSNEESKTINEKNYFDKSIEKTISIINRTNDGNILLFFPITKDIINAIEKINNMTQPNVIAFPYYGTLDESIKNMIPNLHLILPTYTRKKNDVTKEEDEITETVKEGTYTRAVIIATNVAEASLTLQNLKYVIDSGYVKKIYFDPITNGYIEKIVPVSKSSSVQRRGRVGRLACGEIYYMYSESKVANNKVSYDITNIDISATLIDLIIPYKNVKQTLILENLKMSKFEYVINKLYIKYNFKEYGYYGRLETFEKINKNISDSDFNNYIKNNHAGVYDDNLKIHNLGYTSTTLLDETLDFYIIHPDDNIIKRNKFTGKFIGFMYNESITGEYWNELRKINNITSGNAIEAYYTIEKRGLKLIKCRCALLKAQQSLLIFKNQFIENKLTKTILFKQIGEVNSILNDNTFTTDEIKWISYSLNYNLEYDVIGMILIMKHVENFKKWIDYKNVISSINGNSEKRGDLYFIWKLWQKIKKIFDADEMKITNNDKNKIINKYIERKQQFLNGEKINKESFKILNDELNKNKLIEVENPMLFDDSIKNTQIKEYSALFSITSTEYTEKKIVELLKALKFDPKILTDVISEYIEKVNTLDIDLLEVNRNDFSFNPLNVIANEPIWTKILETYIRAFSKNLIFNDANGYINVQNNSTIPFNYWSERLKKEITFTIDKPRYLLYHSIDSKGHLNYLTPVNLEWVLSLDPIYYYYVIKNMKYATNKTIYKDIVSKFDTNILISLVNKLGLSIDGIDALEKIE